MSEEMSDFEAELILNGAPWWLVREAAASARMAQYDDGTYAVSSPPEDTQ